MGQKLLLEKYNLMFFHQYNFKLKIQLCSFNAFIIGIHIIYYELNMWKMEKKTILYWNVIGNAFSDKPCVIKSNRRPT